jgi:hypothetical protein
MDNALKFVELPIKLADALEKVEWLKVSNKEVDLLIKIGLPFLKQKGYLKNEKEEKT